MPVIVIELAYAIVLPTLGLLGGCWLCRRGTRAANQQMDKILRARDIVACVDELTTRVATDVGTHSIQLKKISDELTSNASAGSAAIVATVATLVAVNEQMHRRLAEAEAKLQEQSRALAAQVVEARTDALTRLPNRRAFDDEVARRSAEFQRHGTPFSVILLDVDHFKRFNDQHGHQAGDEVLRGLAGALRQTMRGSDMAARCGGEEFAVVLPVTSIDAACEAGERYRQAIEQATCQYDGKKMSVTASMGVAQLMPGEQPALLLRRADQALYASKQAGRNSTHWHDGREIRAVATRRDPEIIVGEKASGPPEKRLESRSGGPAKRATPASTRNSVENNLEASDQRPGELLTNECDRTAFVSQVRQRIADWKRGGPGFSVMLLKVEVNDQVTDALGRITPECLMLATRRLLSATLRDMDLIGHYRPACFAVLLPRTPLADAVSVAQRVREGATECVLPGKDAAAAVTLSVGIAELSEDDDVIRLLQRAEAAMLPTEKVPTGGRNDQRPEMSKTRLKS